MKGETMKNPIHQKQTITRHNESLHPSPWRRCILLNSLILACFALSLTAQAITEPKKADEKNNYANVGTSSDQDAQYGSLRQLFHAWTTRSGRQRETTGEVHVDV